MFLKSITPPAPYMQPKFHEPPESPQPTEKQIIEEDEKPPSEEWWAQTLAEFKLPDDYKITHAHPQLLRIAHRK